MTRTVPRGATGPRTPPAATWEKGVAHGRQNLDHNSTPCVMIHPEAQKQRDMRLNSLQSDNT
jgi:hypothetical protein